MINKLRYEREPEIWELEDEQYDWDNIEVDNTVSYGLIENIAYNELMKNFDEELEE